MPEVCRVCRKPAKLKCSRCGEAWYCARECQGQHWSQHKEVCRSIAVIKSLAAPLRDGRITDAADDERVQKMLAAAATVGGEAFSAALDAEMRSGLSDWKLSGLDPGASTLQTLLSKAAQEGNAGTVRELIHAGARVESPAALGALPLHAAAAGGHAEVVTVLADAGASLDKRDSHGMTPLHLAVARCKSAKHVQTVLALGRAGARFDAIVGTPAGVYALPPPTSTPPPAATATGADAPVQAGQDGSAGDTAARARASAWAGRDAISGRAVLHLAVSSELDGPQEGLLTRAVILGCAGQLRTQAVEAAFAGGPGDGSETGAADGFADGQVANGGSSGHAAPPTPAAPAAASTATPSLDSLRAMPLPRLHAGLLDGRDPDGLTPLVYACAHGHIGAARALLEAGACVHGYLPEAAPAAAATGPAPSAGPHLSPAAVLASAAVARLADPSGMPVTFVLEAAAAAIEDESSAAGAAANLSDREKKRNPALEPELLAAVASAKATQARAVETLRLLFGHGAVLPSRPTVDAGAFQQIPWEEAGLTGNAAASGVGASGADATGATTGKGQARAPATASDEDEEDKPEGSGLLLPQLAAACTDPALAPVVQACVASYALPGANDSSSSAAGAGTGALAPVSQHVPADPRALASDGQTTALHVACLSLNLPAVQALVAALHGGAVCQSSTGGSATAAGVDGTKAPATVLPEPASLERCLKAGLAWAHAHAAELSPGNARSVLATAQTHEQAIRTLLGLAQPQATA